MTPHPIYTIAELSRYVQRIDQASGVDRHNAFGAFSFEMDFSALNALDPFSAQYRDAVLAHYEAVACKSYTKSLGL